MINEVTSVHRRACCQVLIAEAPTNFRNWDAEQVPFLFVAVGFDQKSREASDAKSGKGCMKAGSWSVGRMTAADGILYTL